MKVAWSDHLQVEIPDRVLLELSDETLKVLAERQYRYLRAQSKRRPWPLFAQPDAQAGVL